MASRNPRKRAVCGRCGKQGTKKGEFLPGPDGREYHTSCVVRLEDWSECIFGLPGYGWQKGVWADVGVRDSRVALRAANGSGKTSMIAAAAALWNAMTSRESTTVVTSGVKRQITKQFWPALRRLMEVRLVKGGESVTIADAWDMQMTEDGVDVKRMGSRIEGFTAADTFKFEGFHRTGPDENLMMVVDEAKGIKDDIFDAVERCQPSRLLMQSSPGPAVGAFWRAWGPEREFWVKHVVEAKDCPHLMNLKVRLKDGGVMSWVESIIAKYGPSAPLTKSMIYADWMSDDKELLVCPLHWWDRCFENPPRRQSGERALGIDVAAGGDENVVAHRDGNQVEIVDAWRDKDTHQAVVRVASIIRRLGLDASECFLDVGGMGVVFADALAAIGLQVQRVNFGGNAIEKENYRNRGTELWVTAARRIERCEVILPDDDELRGQMTSRRYTTPGGKMLLESKDEMRARGLNSPDRADALVMALAGGQGTDSLLQGQPYGQSAFEGLLSAFGELTEREPLVAGIDCGG